MASHINTTTLRFSLLQELPSNEIIKKNQAYLVTPGGRKHEILPKNSFKLKLEHLEPWKPLCSLSKSSHTIMKPKVIDAVTLALVKSPKKAKHEPSPKKQNPKIRDREKDLYKRNHLHAYESLISLMISSEQHREVTMLSVKKSRGDLSELLTRLSVGFAGTGMAVFFFVVCNVASRQVPFCANKVFDTALGFSLVLLSWTVNRLREAVVDVNRKANKEEEIANRVERRVKDVYFKAATVMIIVALRFG